MVNRRHRVASVLVGILASISVVSVIFISGRYAQFGSAGPSDIALEIVQGVHRPMLSNEAQEVTAEDFRELFESQKFE
jgi:hypothetical protein